MINATAFMGKEELKDFLLNKTEIRGEHWLYIGAIDAYGYGRLQINYKYYKVHRLGAYIFHDLDLNNSNQFALHKVECKFKNCWSPTCIYIGTQLENIRDAVKGKTHSESRKTHCPQGHPYNDDNTMIASDGSRKCRACNKEKCSERHKRFKKFEGLTKQQIKKNVRVYLHSIERKPFVNPFKVKE